MAAVLLVSDPIVIDFSEVGLYVRFDNVDAVAEFVDASGMACGSGTNVWTQDEGLRAGEGPFRAASAIGELHGHRVDVYAREPLEPFTDVAAVTTAALTAIAAGDL